MLYLVVYWTHIHRLIGTFLRNSCLVCSEKVVCQSYGIQSISLSAVYEIMQEKLSDLLKCIIINMCGSNEQHLLRELERRRDKGQIPLLDHRVNLTLALLGLGHKS